jgi:hypothetical protein
MGFAVRHRREIKDREVYEVGYTNLYGSFRIEDVWSPRNGTREECKEFVERASAALKDIGKDILAKRKSDQKDK